METTKNTAWARFWEERGRSYPADDPIAIDGWDYGISQMGIEQAEFLQELAARELDLGSHSKFLEVGCGAGMLLGPLSGLVESAVGCDLAESMVKRGRRIMESLEVQVADACNLPYVANKFDAVLIYSVFHYFPSYDYANRALGELYRVCRRNGRIWIGDVPDLSTQRQALTHREQSMKQSVPRWPWPKIGPLDQRFYEKKFFVEFCEQTGCEYRFVQQRVEGYVQGQYRYNVFVKKR